MHVTGGRVVLAAFVAGACAPPGDDGPVHTENLEVVDRTGGRMCRGVPGVLEREFQRVSNLQGIALPAMLPIIVEFGEEAVEDRCEGLSPDGAVAGCAMTGNGQVGIATDQAPASHELVHASRLAAGIGGITFFEEGLAQAIRGGELGGYPISDDAATDPLDPVLLVEGFARSLGPYITAGHFVSWLRDVHGAETLYRALTSDAYASASASDEVEPWFEDAFGETLVQATSRWRAESPLSYWQPGPCSADAAIVVEQEAMLGGVLDCSSEASVGSIDQPDPARDVVRSLPRCFDFSTTGVFQVSVEGSADVRLWFSSLGDDGDYRGGTEVVGGESISIDFSGRYAVVTASLYPEGEDPEEAYAVRVVRQ
jgi:hypothetical protein